VHSVGYLQRGELGSQPSSAWLASRVLDDQLAIPRSSRRSQVAAQSHASADDKNGGPGRTVQRVDHPSRPRAALEAVCDACAAAA
jgi:hypothetical protein